jgi:hypothetical protein
LTPHRETLRVADFSVRMFSHKKDSLHMHDHNEQSVASYDPEMNRWLDVARVANLAEAGFIVDELIGLGFQARVHQFDEFSAALDRWSAQYLIQVPIEIAEAVADHIRQYLAEEPRAPRTTFEMFRESVTAVPRERTSTLRPVLIVMLVGVASFILGHQYSEQAAPSPRRSTDLSTEIANLDLPFISESLANQPTYRLSFDQRRHCWTLGEDRDHDGVYESNRQFTAAGAAR